MESVTSKPGQVGAAGLRRQAGRTKETKNGASRFRQRVHDPSGSQGPADSARAGTAHRLDLAAVPAHPGGNRARRRFLPRRLRADAAASLPVGSLAPPIRATGSIRAPTRRINAVGRVQGFVCARGAWRLIGNLSGPLGDCGEVVCLD